MSAQADPLEGSGKAEKWWFSKGIPLNPLNSGLGAIMKQKICPNNKRQVMTSYDKFSMGSM